jgi:hypothetical protein
MSSPAYLSQKLTRPIPTKDGRTLRTIREVRDYVLALPERRALREQWQMAAKMIIEHGSVPALSRQVELTLFYEAKLDVRAMDAIRARSSAAACAPARATRTQRPHASRRK